MDEDIYTIDSTHSDLYNERGEYDYQFHNPYLNFNIDAMIHEMTGGTIRDTLDEIYKVSNLGPVSNAYGNHLFGINHQHMLNHVPHNNEHIGLTFFTKPSLNLSDNAIVGNPLFANLASGEANSLQRAIRCMLDHRLALNMRDYPCQLNDPFQSFLPVLTNSLMTLSGMPSISMSTGTTPRGIAKEEFTWIDDHPDNFSAYDLQATFRNSQGNLIMMLFYYWIRWAASSYISPMLAVRYIDDIMANRMSYTSRIYRLMLDSTRRYVTSIWACGYCFPTSVEIGSIAHYDHEKAVNTNTKTMDVTFRCSGSMFNEDILVETFNQTVWMLNGSMKDENRNHDMTKIPMFALRIFSHKGYPRINPNTYELEWYVTKAEYEAEKTAIDFLSAHITGY